MLATLRRQQKWILIVVAAIIIVAFAWFYNKMDYSPQPGATAGTEAAFSVYGKTYTARTANRHAKTYSLLHELGLEEFAETLRGERGDRDLTDFAINLTVLRREAEKLAILPSREKVTRQIRELPPFTPNGAFDAQIYQRFLENFLTPNGFTQSDFEQIISDSLTFEKLQELFAANIEASPQEVDQIFTQSYTQHKAARIDIPVEQVKDQITVSEDEIKKFYEENKQAFLSDAQRRIAYVYFPRPALENNDPGTPEEAPGETKDEATAPELDPQDRLAKENEMRQQVHEFVTTLAGGKSFTDTAKEQGLEIQRPDAFSLSDFPEELKDAYALQGEIVKATLSKPVSKPVSTSKGYYVFELLEVIEGKPLELEDAREDIVNVLTDQKTTEALSKRADTVKAQIEASLKSGKDIAAAALEAKAELKEIPPFSIVKDPPDDRTLMGEAMKLKPGEIGKAESASSPPFLVYLESTTLPDDDETRKGKEELTEYLAAGDGYAAFRGWLQQKIIDANASKSISYSAGDQQG